MTTRPVGASLLSAMGPLFVDQPWEDDKASGIIYVCLSKSDHPLIEKK
jgi:hypothetical protein